MVHLIIADVVVVAFVAAVGVALVILFYVVEVVVDIAVVLSDVSGFLLEIVNVLVGVADAFFLFCFCCSFL